MAFRDYIVLNGYRYKTPARSWKPTTERPATARLTLMGNLEATFGAGALKKWEGTIAAVHGEEAPGPADGTLYGNIFTLRQALQQRSLLMFNDHYGDGYQVVSMGPFDETMLHNVWNALTNKYYVRVTLVAKA